MILEQAAYHLSYEVKDEVPVISLHTDPANLEGLHDSTVDLNGIRAYLGIKSPFTFEDEAFGYEGVGTVGESVHVIGWSALQLALPKAETSEGYYSSPTPHVLPIVTTLSVALSYLKRSVTGRTDPQNPQLVIASLSNRRPLDDFNSAPLSATITPAALERLAAISDIESAEERVRRALFTSYQYPDGPYGYARDDNFRVTLVEDISFDYPGDGTGFFASTSRNIKRDGLTINAANNDHSIQQVGIIGGLAALNDIVLGK